MGLSLLSILLLSSPMPEVKAAVQDPPEAGLLRGNPEGVVSTNIPFEWIDGNSYTDSKPLAGTTYSFSFSKPKDITGYYFNASNSTRLKMYSKDQLLVSITGNATTKSSYTSADYKSVTHVEVVDTAASNSAFVSEIDLKGTDSIVTEEPVITPPSQTGDSSLIIYLVSGLTRQYELNSKEIANFLGWYNQGGISGSEFYIFDRNATSSDYASQKDYIAYDKIEMFEVNKKK